MERYGIDNLSDSASKLGAEVIEIPLEKIIKEAYLRSLKIIIDPNLYPYKRRHLMAHGLTHHFKLNEFLEQD